MEAAALRLGENSVAVGFETRSREQAFQRHTAAQPLIESQKHLPHPAAAQPGEDRVVLDWRRRLQIRQPVVLGAEVDERSAEVVDRIGVRQDRQDFVAHIGLVLELQPDVGRALGSRQALRFVQHVFRLLPRRLVHQCLLEWKCGG